MNDTAQLITAWATLLTSVGTLIAAGVAARSSYKNKAAIEQIHAATNGMKTELVAEVRAAALAKGNLQGRADEKAEANQ